MKKKNDITPPSKGASPLTKKEKIKALSNKYRASQRETNAVWDELDAEKNYDESLEKASKKLKIKKEDLDSTFHENKGELVKKFRKAKGDGTVGTFSFITGICATFGSLISYIGVTEAGAEPLIVMGALFGAMGIFGGVIVKKEFNKKATAQKSISTQVTEHQKRLADMSAKPA